MNEFNPSFQGRSVKWYQGIIRTGTLILFLAIGCFPASNAWALQVTPISLSFQAVQGGTAPASQIVNVLKNNARTLNWNSTDTARWVSLSPTTGTITSTAQIAVSVNPAGLAAGTYTATVTVSIIKGGSVSIPVSLTVTTASSLSSTSTSTSNSNTAALTWNPSTSTNVAGYKVYVGTASGAYSGSIDVGNVTNYIVPNLTSGSTYYFAVTDYNSSGIESSFSNEVSKSIY